jgi:hypothetical protein
MTRHLHERLRHPDDAPAFVAAAGDAAAPLLDALVVALRCHSKEAVLCALLRSSVLLALSRAMPAHAEARAQMLRVCEDKAFGTALVAAMQRHAASGNLQTDACRLIGVFLMTLQTRAARWSLISAEGLDAVVAALRGPGSADERCCLACLGALAALADNPGPSVNALAQAAGWLDAGPAALARFPQSEAVQYAGSKCLADMMQPDGPGGGPACPLAPFMGTMLEVAEARAIHDAAMRILRVCPDKWDAAMNCCRALAYVWKWCVVCRSTCLRAAASHALPATSGTGSCRAGPRSLPPWLRLATSGRTTRRGCCARATPPSSCSAPPAGTSAPASTTRKQPQPPVLLSCARTRETRSCSATPRRRCASSPLTVTARRRRGDVTPRHYLA